MKKNLLVILFTLLTMCGNAIAQERTVEIVKGGKVVFSSPAEDLDYLTVVDRLPIPDNINGIIDNGKIIISWSVVNNATCYQVFRSSDGSDYSEIGIVDANSYTDDTPLSGSNYYCIQAIGENNSISSLSQAICIEYMEAAELQGLSLGILGFNRDLDLYPIERLDDNSKPKFDGFVDNLQMKNGTILYYSVDEALSLLKSTEFPEDIQNVALVTFTDGLDQGSMMLNDKYSTDEEYLSELKNKITNLSINNINLNAYAVGVRGSDVTDIEKFTQNLQSLASSNDNAYEVSEMAQVNSAFQKIANELNKTTFTQTLSLTMPGVANGTRVRFTLDNIISADRSNIYIEGSFNLKDKSLENTIYHGLKSASGETVYGSVKDGIFVTFLFEELTTENGLAIQPDVINEWTYTETTNSWQINSEFEREDDINITTIHKSAAVFLVIDCSSSLGSQFDYLKASVKSFIETLCLSTPQIINPDINCGYSTTPFDYALAVQKDGIIYYLTPYDYNRAGGIPSGYDCLGVILVDNNEPIVVGLSDHFTGSVSWKISEYHILTYAPSLDIARIVVNNINDLNEALPLYNGVPLNKNYWTNERFYDSLNKAYVYYYFNQKEGIKSFMSNADDNSTFCLIRHIYKLQ